MQTVASGNYFDSSRKRSNLYFEWKSVIMEMHEITKLPNSEQSSKGKVKTYQYINRQNQSTTGKLNGIFVLTMSKK